MKLFSVLIALEKPNDVTTLYYRPCGFSFRFITTSCSYSSHLFIRCTFSVHSFQLGESKKF